MTALIIFVLLVLKHAISANLIDYGYSASRSRHYPAWRWALVQHLALEATLSFPIMVWSHWPWWGLYMGVELSIQALSCILERRSTYATMLRAHVLCELALLVLYAICGASWLR